MVEQAAPLHLVIPSCYWLFCHLNTLLKKESHIPGSVKLPRGDVLFCPSCHSSVPQMSQWKTSTWSHSLTINKNQKVKRGIFENVKNKGSFKTVQVYTSGAVDFQAESDGWYQVKRQAYQTRLWLLLAFEHRAIKKIRTTHSTYNKLFHHKQLVQLKFSLFLLIHGVFKFEISCLCASDTT